ncbi:RhoGEF domain [Legionella hackeliae]|uniref:RhoGEF domain-containing protein n=1 Tax=Legionella hackeliae TaxID=449 RepID=UPI000E15D76C|nr:RhoGEF domain-containing protein [Legionella hackeliae]STX48151.1 RhoGEF domain [Legionella hackeliae]
MLAVNQIQDTLTEHKAIQEMLDTEKNYNDALDRLLMVPSELMPDNVLFAQLKNYLPQLKNISDMLLKNVTMSLGNDIDPSALNQLKAQRTQLLKAFFTLYQDYARWYETYAKEVAINPRKFMGLDLYLSESHASKLGLSDYLIQPFQRGPRYNLLVIAAIEYNNKLPSDDSTKLSDESIADLVKIRDVIRDYLKAANSSMSTPQATAKAYQFGDYTWAALNFLSEYVKSQESQTMNVKTSPASGHKSGYKFGNVSRAIWTSIWSKPEVEKNF